MQEHVSGEDGEDWHDCGDWIGTGEVGIHLHYSPRLEGRTFGGGTFGWSHSHMRGTCE